MGYSNSNSVNAIEEATKSTRVREKTLYYFGIEPPLPGQLFRELAGTPIILRGFNNANDMVRASTQHPADMLLLDPTRLPDKLTSIDLLTRMEMRSGIRPVMICLATTPDIRSRIKALREGAVAVFPIPVNVADVAAKLKEIAVGGSFDPYRIMVVDEHEVHSKIMMQFLESAGMQTVVVRDPLEVMSTLESFRPDLLLMDLYMPEIRGDELASLIRDNRNYNDIPIVFISGEVDSEHQLHAMSVGGDEFLAKPIERPRLIATVKHRIERARSIRAAHELDEHPQEDASPTYSHRFLMRLEQAIADDRPPSQGSGLFYIKISATGRNLVTDDTISADSIRASVGTLVHDRLGAGDFVERLDAYDYAMYANRTNNIELRESAEDLLNALNQHTVELEQQKILIKASIGIGYVRPLGDDALALISRACTACAKAARLDGGGIEDYVSVVADSPLDVAPSQAEPSLRQIVPKEERIAALIRAALDGDDFQLLYQPVLTLRKNQSSRREVQLRMKTPDGELISPLNFIPVAERFGWMEEIDRWVMLKAFETLQQQRDKGCNLRFFIHQTAASLQSKDWVLWLREQIVRRDLINLRPILQFRSDEILDNSETATAHLRILKRLGISVCLINITGQNDQLKLFERLPVRMIAKLAVSHVANSETQALTKLVREFHRLDARVFATGIENYQTIGRVWHCGFDFIQGNFIQFPHADPEFDASALRVVQQNANQIAFPLGLPALRTCA